MRQHEPMDIFMLHEGKVYAAHYKAGAKTFCQDECDIIRKGLCSTKGHKRVVCGILDAYWKEVKA